MSLFKTFGTDAAKEANGVKLEYAPNDDGTIPSFTVARIAASNTRYTKALERKTRPYRRQIDLEILDKSTADDLIVKTFIESILLGWDNILNADGKVLTYNTENALALFKALPELFWDLHSQASKASLFRSDEQEAAAKN